MTAQPRGSYSPLVMRGWQQANAFVVQFRKAAESDEARAGGRIEHVESGRTATFQSIDELPQLFKLMLRNLTSDKGTEPNG